MASYVTAPVNSLYKIPEGVDFPEATVIEPLRVMLRAFERCDMKPGDDIAIIGPGPIGLLGVNQIGHYPCSHFRTRRRRISGPDPKRRHQGDSRSVNFLIRSGRFYFQQE